MTREFESRKAEHLSLSLDPRFQASGASQFDEIRLNHNALCELNFDEINLATWCLGFESATPFYVSAMTAGHDASTRVNEGIAQACAERGWVFSVGSQRKQLFAKNQASQEFLGIRELVKSRGLRVISNIGASQLAELSVQAAQQLVDSISASAFAVHLNPLQECMQPEGTPQFKGVLNRLAELKKALSVPLILKETGCGLSASAATRAMQAGVDAVDISGLGGTHWGRIEGARAIDQGRPDLSSAAQTFQNWGIPTVQSLIATAKAAKINNYSGQVWASGGVRSGLDAAKSIALGAHMVGYAQPALKAWEEGRLSAWMKQIEVELKIALFCTGSRDSKTLRESEDAWTRIENY